MGDTLLQDSEHGRHGRNNYLCGRDRCRRHREDGLHHGDNALDSGGHCLFEPEDLHDNGGSFTGQREDGLRLENNGLQFAHYVLRHEDNCLRLEDNCRSRSLSHWNFDTSGNG